MSIITRIAKFFTRPKSPAPQEIAPTVKLEKPIGSPTQSVRIAPSASIDLSSWDGFGGSKFPGALRSNVLNPEKLSLKELRFNSDLEYRRNTHAHGAIETKNTITIGAGLRLEAKPQRTILENSGLAVPDEWEKNTEARYDLWAKSKGSSYNWQENFYFMQAEAYRDFLLKGECIAIPRYQEAKSKGRVGRLNIQLMPVKSLATPMEEQQNKKAIGEEIIGGKHLDKTGTIVGYYFKTSSQKPGAKKWVYIRRWGEKTGRVSVINPIRKNKTGSIDPFPDLTPVLHDLSKIGEFSTAEIQAALVNSMIALIQNSDGQNTNPQIKLSAGKRVDTITNPDGNEDTKITYTPVAPGMHLFASKIGQKLESFDTKRPNTNYGQFLDSALTGAFGSLGLSTELVNKKFGGSFSASRGTLLEVWRYVLKWREYWTSEFNQIIYELWLSDEIAFGRINAPGWENKDPIIRAAWANADFHGSAKGSIDPLKEMRSAEIAEDRGWTTAEKNSRELFGNNFDSTIYRRKKEIVEQRKIQLEPPIEQAAQNINNLLKPEFRADLIDLILEEIQEGKNE